MNATNAAPAIAPQRNPKKLANLRQKPSAQLIVDSVLGLKTYQMDMDCPPPVRAYVREQMSRFLVAKTTSQRSPDDLYVQFSTETHPSVDLDGRERYSWRLSLTDLGIASFHAASFVALIRCADVDRPLDDGAPLSAGDVIDYIMNARWTLDYTALVEGFWDKHESNYCTLAKLSFLEGVAQQLRRKKISLEGYVLALDALGLERFPDAVADLEQPAKTQRTRVHLLALDGHVVPGVFQLQSNTTSHCFIHTLGEKPLTVEYISNDAEVMKKKLLEAMNSAAWLGLWVSFASLQKDQSINVELIEINEDLFAAISAAQKTFSLERLEGDSEWEPTSLSDVPLLKPIERGLRIVCTFDLWEVQPQILQRIPTPLKTAGRVMRTLLNLHHELDINPEQVFIRYVRGTSFTPLGNARTPSNYVHVPSEKPLSLSEALMTNYRVEGPVGYIDEGGRNVVYTDPTGKGEWSADRELTLSAERIEEHIKAFDFLTFMSANLDSFWGTQKTIIEQTFKASFMAQAVLCLKRGSLSRSGFDVVVAAADQLSASHRSTQWVVLGFYLQSSVIDGPQERYCAGLWVLVQPGKSQRILYQAGRPKAFVEFNDSDELNRYIQQAAREEAWRQSVLNYVPVRYQERLTYILKLWTGEQAPMPPVSNLRPWTDVIYNHDAHKAMAHSLCEQVVPGSPFAFMRETLQRNGLYDAEDQIVTDKEVLLRYWTSRLNHLQTLLAPMSFFLTPAMLASMAIEFGIVSLNIASANLPGARQAEKKQVILAALSFGLLQLAPYTPRLLRSFGKLTAPVKTAVRKAPVAVVAKSFGSLLNRSIAPRNTRLETFFGTNSLLKTWSIAAHPVFRTSLVKIWKLEQKFLLWTSGKGQARTLVVSTHGYHLPGSRNTPIPSRTELHVYAPHGYILIDPGLHRIIRRRVNPLAILKNTENTLVSAPNLPTPYVMTDKLLAGTSQPGMIKNYSLSKYQTPQYESYDTIGHAVSNSNQSPFHGHLPSAPMDVLTVRNRFGMIDPTLDDLFTTLSRQGIHYEKILLVHCRCSAIDAAMQRAPVYRAE